MPAVAIGLNVDDSKAGMTDKVRVLPFIEGHVPRINKRREEEVFPVCAHCKAVCGADSSSLDYAPRGGRGGYLIWTTFISRSDKNKMKSRCHLLHQASSQSIWLVFIFAGKTSKMVLLLLML